MPDPRTVPVHRQTTARRETAIPSAAFTAGILLRGVTTVSLQPATSRWTDSAWLAGGGAHNGNAGRNSAVTQATARTLLLGVLSIGSRVARP